ncbi:MAG: exosortase system-associated protein, TIGR04073 family [Candidatus Omnitrophota bacterium]|jgi:putative exosortase-associated protein (TIGR04073 family)
MKKIASYFVFLVTCLSFIAPAAMAGERGAWDYTVDISSKFGRGLTNIVTSPVEIPCNVANEMDSMGPYKGFLPGMGLGIFKFGRRLFNGVLDIGTFVIPSPNEMPYVCEGRKEKPVTADAV